MWAAAVQFMLQLTLLQFQSFIEPVIVGSVHRFCPCVSLPQVFDAFKVVILILRVPYINLVLGLILTILIPTSLFYSAWKVEPPTNYCCGNNCICCLGMPLIKKKLCLSLMTCIADLFLCGSLTVWCFICSQGSPSSWELPKYWMLVVSHGSWW